MADDSTDEHEREGRSRSKRHEPVTLDSLPLFASDRELAVALLGKERGRAWRNLVPIYERNGFPKIDPLMGGRYTRAVLAFFDREYGLTERSPLAPPGVERVIDWNVRKPRKRRGFAARD